MEAYIDSLTAPKRRQTQALPLLPVGASSDAKGADSGSGGDCHSGKRQQQQKRKTIGDDDTSGGSKSRTGGAGGGVGGSTLVSMLLPTRNGSAQQSGGNLTALDQIFVVMMEPSDTYATYSCRLPSPVLL